MKHAYLILAHKNDTTFQTLLEMLDYPENDIFIHMDRKNKDFSGENEEQLKREAKHSSIYFTNRSNVMWGGYSLVNAILILLKNASDKGKYVYYHLLSGEDLPIQTHETIEDFFSENMGKEFLDSGPLRNDYPYKDDERVRYFHLFQDILGRGTEKLLLRAFRRSFLEIQRLLKVHRNKNIEFMRGSNWFSITDDLARFLINEEKQIRKIFKFGFCVDELFVQTMIHNTIFEERIHPSMRLIDWERGNPYIWRYEDKDRILGSNQLFARKFDCRVDKEIILIVKNVFTKN